MQGDEGVRIYCFILQLHISGCFHFSCSGHRKNCSPSICVKIESILEKWYCTVEVQARIGAVFLTHNPANLHAMHPYKGII